MVIQQAIKLVIRHRMQWRNKVYLFGQSSDSSSPDVQNSLSHAIGTEENDEPSTCN
jgi:hypothetical protein